MNFSPSTFYQAWVSRLRLPWLDAKGKAIMGAFAKVLGDLTIDWGMQANFEHLPEFASAPSVALTASERQIDAGPAETTSALATRLTKATQLWKYAGTPWGTLLALHFAGFDYGVLVQQNGLAFSLTLPLPVINSDEDWDPTPSFVITNTSALAITLQGSVLSARGITRGIPASNRWWAFDPNTDFCSRFALLWPGPLFPSYFTTSGRATFTGAEDSAPVVWSNPFPDTTYCIRPGAAGSTTGDLVAIAADLTTKTMTGVSILTSGRFTGSVDVLAYQAGANPFADPHPADLARLKSVVGKWKPKKSTCNGAYVLAQGKFSGWPVDKASKMLGVPSTVIKLAGSESW